MDAEKSDDEGLGGLYGGVVDGFGNMYTELSTGATSGENEFRSLVKLWLVCKDD